MKKFKKCPRCKQRLPHTDFIQINDFESGICRKCIDKSMQKHKHIISIAREKVRIAEIYNRLQSEGKLTKKKKFELWLREARATIIFHSQSDEL